MNCKIPRSFYDTKHGAYLAGVMHSEGWDVSSYLDDCISATDLAIQKTRDKVIRGELERAREEFKKAKSAFWAANGILTDSAF